jgi:hypothetical protein
MLLAELHCERRACCRPASAEPIEAVFCTRVRSCPRPLLGLCPITSGLTHLFVGTSASITITSNQHAELLYRTGQPDQV